MAKYELEDFIGYCLSLHCWGLMTYHEVLYVDWETKLVHIECKDCGERTTK